MNVNQMYVVQTVAVVSFKTHQFVSVCQNTKVTHRARHVNHQKMLVLFQPAVQIRNAHVSLMELPSARVYLVTSKVQIRCEDALSQEAHANHSHADWEHRVMLHADQFAIAPKELLEIHSNNVAVQLLLENCANQAHVEVSLTEEKKNL